MGFDSGSVNFRLFYLREQMTAEVLSRFEARMIPPLETLTSEGLHGWIGPDHALDRDLSEEHCCLGPYLHLSHVTADKKIPPSTLRAYVKAEERVEMRARNMTFLPRAVKTEVRERITDELMAHALPSFASLPLLIDLDTNLLLASAMSQGCMDMFCPFFKETTGVMPIPLTPENAALARRQINAKDLLPANFTPDTSVDVPYEVALGNEFMTWLLFFWEREGGTFKCDGEQCGMMIEGPLLMYAEGAGSFETVLRKGTPLDSRELGVALYAGKKLKRAKVTLTQGECVVSATIDATEFTFSSMKLPRSEQDDALGIFQDRMEAIKKFNQMWFYLFDKFLDLRSHPAQWERTLGDLRAWIDARFRRD